MILVEALFIGGLIRLIAQGMNLHSLLTAIETTCQVIRVGSCQSEFKDG